MTTSLGLHYHLMARFNREANRRLMAAYRAWSVAAAGDAEREFGDSLIRQLNRALLADQIWLARVEGRLAAEPPASLVLYSEPDDLAIARDAVDAWLESLVAGIDPWDYRRTIAWRDGNGRKRRTGMVLVLAELFERQAGDRTRIALSLETAGAPVPRYGVLDTLASPPAPSEPPPGHKAVTAAGALARAARSLLDWCARRRSAGGSAP